jgi:hypothetical protein
MCMRVTKRTSQHFVIEQFPAKHIKVSRTLFKKRQNVQLGRLIQNKTK